MRDLEKLYQKLVKTFPYFWHEFAFIIDHNNHCITCCEKNQTSNLCFF